MNEVDKRLGKGSSVGYTSRIEKGERPNIRPSSLEGLANVLNVRVEWLVSGRNPPPDLPLPPSLELVAEELRAEGYAEWLLRQAAVFYETHDDLTPLQWREYIEGLRREARRMELEVKDSAPPNGR
jgi:transcriptional regulator with XRE-family HTH domain